MAVVVQNKQTGKLYVVLGAGYGMWAHSRPNSVLGDLFAKDRGGSSTSLCVCDASGRIGWVQPDLVAVVSVDGMKPDELLQ